MKPDGQDNGAADAITAWFLRAVNGDEQGAAALYAACFPPLAAWLRGRVQGELAADTAHDALALVIARGARLRLAGPLLPWLRTVALRIALNRVRHEQRRARRERDFMDAHLTSRAQPAEDRRLPVLAACLGAIPERQRQLVERHFFANESSASIARSQNRTRGAVAVELHRICRALRRQIEERAPVEMAA